MKSFAFPMWLIWIIVIVIAILIGIIFFLLIKDYKRKKLDKIIFINQDNRWEEKTLNLKGFDFLNLGNSTYELTPNTALLNKRGKSLFIFSKNQPIPMGIKYRSWYDVDTKSLQAKIKNMDLQKIARGSDAIKDILLLIGAIGGIIAGISSLLILAIQLGIISPK